MSTTEKMIRKLVLLVIGFGMDILVAQAFPADSTKIHLKDSLINDVLMGQLISKPTLYKGQVVRVTGYFVQQRKHGALYAHKQDYALSIKKNGLWTSFSPTVAGRRPVATYLKSYGGNYVVVVGTFHSAKGLLGKFSGAVRAITKIDTLESDQAVSTKP